MTQWHHDYLSALEERDGVERANEVFIESYTRMADRTIQTLTPSSEVRVHSESDNVKIGATPLVARDHGPTTSMREDFAEAQRLRASLQSRLDETEDELERLKRRAGRDAVRLAELGAEKNSLLVRLRDRDEELKGKMKLVEDVQDESISLHLQLNMAEERSAKLQKENQDLIDRWMARMGVEAEAMNNASRYS